jgi:hypothetical protein
MMDPKSMADPLGAGKGRTVAVTAIVGFFVEFFRFAASIFQTSSSDPREKKVVEAGTIQDFIDVTAQLRSAEDAGRSEVCDNLLISERIVIGHLEVEEFDFLMGQ